MEKQSRYPREDNMETQKKTWETPQLIVLGRGRPEESVLTEVNCKITGRIGPGNKPNCRIDNPGSGDGLCHDVEGYS